MARIPDSQCRGQGFDPWLGTKIPHATWHGWNIEEKNLQKNSQHQQFPGGPEVRAWHFHCWGPRFDPWLGKWDLQKQKTYITLNLNNTNWNQHIGKKKICPKWQGAWRLRSAHPSCGWVTVPSSLETSFALSSYTERAQSTPSLSWRAGDLSTPFRMASQAATASRSLSWAQGFWYHSTLARGHVGHLLTHRGQRGCRQLVRNRNKLESRNTGRERKSGCGSLVVCVRAYTRGKLLHTHSCGHLSSSHGPGHSCWLVITGQLGTPLASKPDTWIWVVVWDESSNLKKEMTVCEFFSWIRPDIQRAWDPGTQNLPRGLSISKWSQKGRAKESFTSSPGGPALRGGWGLLSTFPLSRLPTAAPATPGFLCAAHIWSGKGLGFSPLLRQEEGAASDQAEARRGFLTAHPSPSLCPNRPLGEMMVPEEGER